ncbi:hypothetical protein [Borrelia turicatae]|uniref:SH3b domain-containing protein n=2 Tax=Borrelia turicatae TaxID=142 RepID=A0A172XC69_BORTU|nr:hypothetical protein [Borrelia turicatae]AAX18138.1 hypothetical protein BT0823 [Borrelia turicatae 91E135]ANF34266.1 hypothetical protein A7978_04170 [Borrelia turicatae]UPA13635.1 hypothetical protein bt91E135_000832 [Borrelia turicatae 91E135]UPA15115.1 hypothetical protein btBTE5EL_000830 [Borrelia turicatae]
MKIKLLYLISIMFLTCSKKLETPLINEFNLPKSSILGFSRKVGIITKNYAILNNVTKTDNTNYNYLTIIRKDEIVKIEKIMQNTEQHGIKGKWILATYKGKKGYIFSKDINIIDNIIIE